MAAYATAVTEPIQPIDAAVRSSALTRDDVMTASEVADLLKMPVSTIYELARRGEPPARRLAAAGASCARAWRSYSRFDCR
jgi:excisionase family DNA binding protein